jgi:hypothetical protein
MSTGQSTSGPCKGGRQYAPGQHAYLPGNSFCFRCGACARGSSAAKVSKVHLAGSIDGLPMCTQHESSANTRDISKWVCTRVRADVTCKLCRRFVDRT